MKRKLYVSLVITLVSFLFLLVGAGTASAQSVTPPGQDSQASVENSRAEEATQGSVPVSPIRSRVDVWFNRSGSGLFIALTPFATSVTLLVLLLSILLPFLFRAAYRRGKRGYFKTVYTGQRRHA